MAPFVAPPLRPVAAELGRITAETGRVVEAALVAHGRRIVDEQQLLTRLADATIAAYAAAVVLSRASRAVRLSFPGAEHEVRLAEAAAEDALERATRRLAAAREPRARASQSRLAQLGADVAAAGGAVHRTPLNL